MSITPGLIRRSMRQAADRRADRRVHQADQYDDADMIKGYPRLGEGLLGRLAGPPLISAFCSYVGTASCFLGVAAHWPAPLPSVHGVIIWPPG